MNFKNLDKKRKLVLLSLLGSIVIALVTVTYAFFTTNADNTNKFEATLSTANLALTFEDGDNGVNAELGFGESTTKKFKITNTGTKQASLSLDWFELINTYGNESLSFELIETTPEGTKTTIVDGNIPTSSERLTQTLAGELSVDAGKTNTYDLVITLNNLPNTEQSADLSAVLNTRFSVDQPQRYRYFTLKVDPNGGKWDESTSAKEFLLKTGEQKTGINNPTRTGYTFKGWEVIGPGSILEDNTFTMGISYTTLKAKWDANEYDLTVDLDGGSQSNTPTKVKYETPLELEVPEKRGHKFREWQTSDGEVVGNKFTLTSLKAATIKAIYDPIEYNYTILYKTQNIGGSGYTEIDGTKVTGKLAYGETIPSTVPDYTGFTTPTKVTNKKITDNESENVITYEYTRNKYTLTIKPNTGTYDGSTTDKTIENVYYEQEVTISKPVKDGYTFTGWTNNGSGNLSTTGDVNKYKMGAGNSVLTANYEVSTFKYIVYHEKQNIDNNEYTRTTDIDRGSAKINSTVTTSPKSYGAGFTIVEPTGGRGLTIVSDIAFDAEGDPTKNVKTYKYDRNSFNLTLDLDGGTLSDATSPINLKHEKTYTLGTPTKEGHTFDKWTKTAGDDSTLDGSTFKMGTTNATVKAIYTAIPYKYTIQHKTMNTDGINYTVRETESGDSLKANYGSSINGTPKTYTGFKAGSCNPITIGTSISENVVVCTYEREIYTVALSYPGSGVTVSNKGSFPNGTTGDTLTDYFEKEITLPTLTKTGYTLSWSRTSGDGELANSNLTIKGDATITGEWTANTYSITYNANGGKWSDDTVLKSVNSVYDSAYKLPSSDPTRAVNGYTFAGWYTKAIGGEKVTVPTKLTKAENHTLYAHWTNAFTSDVESTLTALGLKTTSGYSDYIKTTSPTPLEFAEGTPTKDTSMEEEPVRPGQGTSSKPETSDNNIPKEGMYMMEDDYGTSYYYRGAVTRNYVKFGTNSEGQDMWWRIIRINGDGSLRLVYDGTQGYENSTTAAWMASYDRFALTGKFNSYSNDAKYVGYKFGGPNGTPSTSKSSADAKETDSNAKVSLEKWYDDNLSKFDRYLTDVPFCIDRSISDSPTEWWADEVDLSGNQDLRGYGGNNTAYGAFNRLKAIDNTWREDPNPTFVCPNENDKLSVSNGGLNRKIGMLTADEIVATGGATIGKDGYDNFSHYLYKTGINRRTLTPSYYNNNAYVFSYDGLNLSISKVSDDMVPIGIDAVINLKAEYAKTLVGEGTIDSPYQLPINATLTALGLKTASGNSDYIKTTNPTSEEFGAGVQSNTEGMYTMEDDYGISYYYRGAVTKNYVKFGKNASNQNMYWRIIRINGDGSLRMIYDGTQGYANRNGAETYQENNTDRFIKTGQAFNANWNDAKYVGYKYGGAAGVASTSKTQAEGKDTDSDIKKVVEEWYDANLKEEDKYLVDETFCVDRSISASPKEWWPGETALSGDQDLRGYGENPTVYGAYGRFSYETHTPTNIPQFTCQRVEDKLTVANKGLGKKIGLITADEVIAAGAKILSDNSYYNFLNKSSSYWYWTLSPSDFSFDNAHVFNVSNKGILSTSTVSNGGAVAPVINLSAEYASKLEGTGIIGNEYRLPSALPDDLYEPMQPEEERDTDDDLVDAGA